MNKTVKFFYTALISTGMIIGSAAVSFAAWSAGSSFMLEASGMEFDVSEKTFTVDVYIDDKAGHAGGIIPVTWPAEDFQVVKISNDKGFYSCSRVTVPLPDKDGQIVLFYDGSLELKNKSGSGKVATLTFQINDGASPGEKEIEFGEVDLFDTVAFCDDYPDPSDLLGVTVTLTDKNASSAEEKKAQENKTAEDTGKTSKKENETTVNTGKKAEEKPASGLAETGKTSSGTGAKISVGSSGKASAQTYSKNWYADANGVWRIKDSKGNMVKSAWVCDDAIPQNGRNIWYLMNQDGSMLAAGLLQDATGNWYSLETNHDGYYGMLRYEDGYYNCNGTKVFLKFEHEHNGSFGAIKNLTAVDKLKKIYGVTAFPAGNESIVYTATF